MPIPVFILIFYSYPIIVAVLSRVLGEGLERMFWPAALLTIAGVVLIVVEEGDESLVGALLAVVSAYLIAMYFVVNQRILRRWYGDRDASNVAIGVAWIVTSGAFTLVLIAFLSGEGLGLAAAREVWWMLLLLSAVVSFGAYVMNLGIQRLGAASASVVATIEPLFTLFFAWALLGEWLEPLQIVAGVLILGSAVLRTRWHWWHVGRAADPPDWQEPPEHALVPRRRAPMGFFWVALNLMGTSLMIIFMRAIFRETLLNPLQVNFWRYLMATPMMWVLVFTVFTQVAPKQLEQETEKHADDEDTRLNRPALIALGVLFAILSVSLAITLENIIAGLFGIIFYASYPVMVALLSLMLGERLPRMFWLVLLGMAVGMVLVLSPEWFGEDLGESSAFGVLLTLLSAFLNSCYILFSRRIMRDTKEVPRAVAWTLIGAFLALAVVVVFTGVHLPDGRDLLFLLGMVVLGTMLPRIAFYLMVQKLGAPLAALISMATPFVTVVLAVLLLDEYLTVPQLIGGALILASMIVLARARVAEEAPPPLPDAQLSTARP